MEEQMQEGQGSVHPAVNGSLSALRAAPLSGVQESQGSATPARLWLWKNFVDGRPEYWAFDNPYPTRMDCGDPQTLGEPCGYALFKPSRVGRTDRTEEQVLHAIKHAQREPSDEARLLARVTNALADLSFECFGGIGTNRPSVETYNRTFDVLQEARAAIARATGASND